MLVVQHCHLTSHPPKLVRRADLTPAVAGCPREKRDALIRAILLTQA